MKTAHPVWLAHGTRRSCLGNLRGRSAADQLLPSACVHSSVHGVALACLGRRIARVHPRPQLASDLHPALALARAPGDQARPGFGWSASAWLPITLLAPLRIHFPKILAWRVPIAMRRLKAKAADELEPFIVRTMCARTAHRISMAARIYAVGRAMCDDLLREPLDGICVGISSSGLHVSRGLGTRPCMYLGLKQFTTSSSDEECMWPLPSSRSLLHVSESFVARHTTSHDSQHSWPADGTHARSAIRLSISVCSRPRDSPSIAACPFVAQSWASDAGATAARSARRAQQAASASAVAQHVCLTAPTSLGCRDNSIQKPPPIAT
ncbi:hypothetical protein GY45DRAFT_1316471 [Cubamyces sp. BRFM 1775]|nr:hypothetical protein GY45DRAFT_1316471 [Cubamyces sp. BRFM 1775]